MSALVYSFWARMPTKLGGFLVLNQALQEKFRTPIYSFPHRFCSLLRVVYGRNMRPTTRDLIKGVTNLDALKLFLMPL